MRDQLGQGDLETPAQQRQIADVDVAAAGLQGVPLARWSSPEIARELAARCQVAVSASSVRRWLGEDALKPWQYRSWISIRDPDFEARAARVLDLYAGRWKGRRLGPDDYVICADEKTSIQARCRCHRTLPPGRARMMRIEHEYKRRDALAYLAAWDVHRGQAAIDRLSRAWPTAHLIHTPTHASWLNRCEIYFSVVQRKVFSPNNFTDTDQIRDHLEAFQAHYNPIAIPYAWGFTRRKLRDLLQRIEHHEHPTENHLQAA